MIRFVLLPLVKLVIHCHNLNTKDKVFQVQHILIIFYIQTLFEMSKRTLFVLISILAISSNAKGGLTSPRSPRSTVSPNDVVAPPVQTIYVPQKESSSKTDALLGALSFTTAVLPYIGHFTDMFKSDEVEKTADPGQQIVLQANKNPFRMLI